MEVSMAVSTARVSGGGAAEQGLGGMLGASTGPTAARLKSTCSVKCLHGDCRARASRQRNCALATTTVAEPRARAGPSAGAQGGLGCTTGSTRLMTAVSGLALAGPSGDLHHRGWGLGRGVGTCADALQTCALGTGRKGRLHIGRLVSSRPFLEGQPRASRWHTSASQSQSRPTVRASGLSSQGPYGPPGVHQRRTRPHAWGSSLVHGPTMSGGTKRGTPSSPADEQPESANQLQSEFWQQQQEQRQQQQQQQQQQQLQQQQQQQELQSAYENGSSFAEAEAVGQGLLSAANGYERGMAALAGTTDKNTVAAEAQASGEPSVLNGVESFRGDPSTVPPATVQEGPQAASSAPPVPQPARRATEGGAGDVSGGVPEAGEGEQQKQKLVLLQQQVERIEQEAQILLQQSLSMKELLGMQQTVEQNQVAAAAPGLVNQQPQQPQQVLQTGKDAPQAEQPGQGLEQQGWQQPQQAEGVLAAEPGLPQSGTAPAVGEFQAPQAAVSNEALQAQAQSRLEVLAQEQAQVLEQAQALEAVQAQQVQEQEQLLEQVQQLVQEQAELQAQEVAQVQELARIQELMQAQEEEQIQELAQIRALAEMQQPVLQQAAPAVASLLDLTAAARQSEPESGEPVLQGLGQGPAAEQQSLLQQPFPVGLVDTKDVDADTVLFEFGPTVEGELVGSAHPGPEAGVPLEAQGQVLVEGDAPLNGAALQLEAEADFMGADSLERAGLEAEGPLSPGGESAVEQQQRQLQLRVGVTSVPHPVKISRGGEDAHLVEGTWLGVADGISAWSEQGVNSGLFSRELLWNCVDVIRSSWELLGVWPHPKAVIEESHSRTDLRGSCTVTLAAVEGQTLKVANIGDSGFVLVRGGELAAQSERMEHGLNDPFQIGCNFGDDPSCAMVYETPVQPGDVILLATDGLFDNVYTEEIVRVLAAEAAEDRDPELVAKKLAAIAHKYGESETGDTPYADLAKAAGVPYEGGRREDVTVIVAYVEDPDDF